MITLDGLKGIYTLNEVIDLLHENDIKVKIAMHSNGTSHIVNGEDYRNLEKKRGDLDGNISL